jgi:hypothetical protein
MVLTIIAWDLYSIDERAEHNISWNTGPKNGYDLCRIVVPTYMRKIGFPDLSLVEAIETGEVEELRHLLDEVGAATAFFSHVQILPVQTTLESLEEAEKMYEDELGKSPKFFLDYCGIRQCVSGDFTVERVVDAIEVIGTTVVELNSELQGDTALLRRIFCVLESFATVKAKGRLLMCGPALRVENRLCN